MQPPLRPISITRDDWGRYDAPGYRTIYCAVPAEAAYGESMAQFRPAIGISAKALFDDDPSEARSLEELVAAEWGENHHMRPGHLAAGWRQERRIHEITLPADGWFIDIEKAHSITTLAAAMPQHLRDRGIENLTTSHLRGDDRRLTTSIASWIRAQILDDGTQPHGICFGSKHDSDWTCWAVWLREVSAGRPASREPTRSSP